MSDLYINDKPIRERVLEYYAAVIVGYFIRAFGGASIVGKPQP